MAVLYLCDGTKCEGMPESIRCYKNGGDCKYTYDAKHAMNFHKESYFDGDIVEYVEDDVVVANQINKDDITTAIKGLDLFTKNWCLNVEETEQGQEPVFRCKECTFYCEDGKCKISIFVNDKKHNYPMELFGAMS